MSKDTMRASYTKGNTYFAVGLRKSGMSRTILDMSIPPKDNGLVINQLTEKQRAFVIAYTSSANKNDAVKVAGYEELGPHVAWRLLRTPAVVAAIQAEVTNRLRVEGATVGVKVLLDIARDDTAPKGVRADCAKALLDRAGYVAPRAPELKADAGKSMQELSLPELRQLVADLERKAADQAKDVSPAQQSGAQSQDIDAQLSALIE